jgi:hypothetical protein
VCCSYHDCRLGHTRCVTMGTIHGVDTRITQSTVKNVKFLVVLGSEEGLAHVQAEFPDLEVCILIALYFSLPYDPSSKIWAAAVDPHLTAGGLISPGLGDTVCILLDRHPSTNVICKGDRLFNSIRP